MGNGLAKQVNAYRKHPATRAPKVPTPPYPFHKRASCRRSDGVRAPCLPRGRGRRAAPRKAKALCHCPSHLRRGERVGSAGDKGIGLGAEAEVFGVFETAAPIGFWGDAPEGIFFGVVWGVAFKE